MLVSSLRRCSCKVKGHFRAEPPSAARHPTSPPGRKNTMNLDETVVLKTYTSDAIASIVASRLGSEGIEVQIQKDDCGGAYPALQMSGGVRLLVKPEHLEKAERILDRMEEEASGVVEPPEESESNARSTSNPVLLIGLFLLGLVVGYVLSPPLLDKGAYTGVVKRQFNAAGKPGAFGHYVNGKLVSVEEDRNYDGKVDAWYHYREGAIHTRSYDNNFDGKEDEWVTYTNQFNFFAKVDTDNDGKPDATNFFVNGLKQRTDWYPHDSVIIERREFFQHGVLNEKLVDTDGDGNFDLKITYDQYERPIAKTKCSIPSYSNER